MTELFYLDQRSWYIDKVAALNDSVSMLNAI